jgi:hypothetical protein
MKHQLTALCLGVFLTTSAQSDVERNPDLSPDRIRDTYLYDDHGAPRPRPLPKVPKLLRPLAAPRLGGIEFLEKPPRMALGLNQTFDMASRTRAAALVFDFFKVELPAFTVEERQNMLTAVRRFEKSGEVAKMVDLLDTIATANLLLEASREVHAVKNADLEIQGERERQARQYQSLYADLNIDLRRDLKSLETEANADTRRALEKNVARTTSEMLLQVKLMLRLLPHGVDFPEGFRPGK